MRPPASPDLNPVDFTVLSMLKKVSFITHTSVDILKTSLLREWSKIAQEMRRFSVGIFRKRIKLLIEKKGHHTENK